MELYETLRQRIVEGFEFTHMVMDELFTFINHKSNRYYVWTAIAYTKSKRAYHFYRLTDERTATVLFDFSLDLPRVSKIYSDEAFAYNKVFAERSILGKGAMTNKIENLNSQLRDKIAYLVRRSKGYAKSELWLNHRLAIFFNDLNTKR